MNKIHYESIWSLYVSKTIYYTSFHLIILNTFWYLKLEAHKCQMVQPHGNQNVKYGAGNGFDRITIYVFCVFTAILIVHLWAKYIVPPTQPILLRHSWSNGCFILTHLLTNIIKSKVRSKYEVFVDSKISQHFKGLSCGTILIGKYWKKHKE